MTPGPLGVGSAALTGQASCPARQREWPVVVTLSEGVDMFTPPRPRSEILAELLPFYALAVELDAMVEVADGQVVDVVRSPRGLGAKRRASGGRRRSGSSL